MSKTVLILGGGTGGVVAANVLSKSLEKKHRLVLVDRNDTHNFRGSYPLLLVNRRRPDQLGRKLQDLGSSKGVEFIQAEVEGLNTARQLVKTSRGPLPYDYLIIALGAEHHPETVPGLAEGAYNPYSFDGSSRLRQKLMHFKEGKIVLFISSLPYTGAIAPYEIIFLLDSYFRRKGLRSKIDLTLVTPEQAPMPLAGPKVSETLRQEMEQKGIWLITQARVLSLDGEEKKLILDHGMQIPGDLFIGIPSHWGPTALRNSGLAEEGGWIQVDPHTLETAAEGVYAIGDATNLKLPVVKAWAPKAGIFAHYQAEVVARNIAALVGGEVPSYQYTGRAGAIMATDIGQGRYLSVNYYKKPRPFFRLLRPSRAAYWGKIAFEKYWLSRWF